MDVVGGTYLEQVSFYNYENLVGSAARAAAVSALGDEDIRLIAHVASQYVSVLENYARAHSFSLSVQETSEYVIGFKYYHGLTDGMRFGEATGLMDCALKVTDASSVLRFGMVEGTALVTGDRVVYDPQSPYPEPFHDNGSNANHLALVLNASEARAWSGKHDLKPAGEYLLDVPDVEVVVIKCGPKGALVFSRNGVDSVPSYRTSYVWPVGSGDVFSGVFAYHWAVEKKNPVQAAQAASISAAYFCETQVLPVPRDPSTTSEFTGVELPVQFGKEPPQIYLAGPFFTLGQRWLVNETRKALLDLGVKVFSPLHDVGDSAKGRKRAEHIADADLEGLLLSDVVLALLDEPDTGTHFEIGYARRAEIPVVVYANTLMPQQRTMLKGTDCQIFDHFPTAVYQFVWRAYK